MHCKQLIVFSLFFLVSIAAVSQEPPKSLSANARLSAAKSVYLKNTSKSDVPFSVLEASFEGWPKYFVVRTPEEADLVVQVDAPVETSMIQEQDGEKKKEEKPKDLVVTAVKLSVLDSHNHVVLWSASDRPTGKGTKDEKTIAATQRLIEAFRTRVASAEAAENKQ
ncbi:MAG TPA: hypothetical protein VN577_06585 [Terriglobales bacterium]|nr:hypothetical protein [Terriglobales bacterium]